MDLMQKIQLKTQLIVQPFICLALVFLLGSLLPVRLLAEPKPSFVLPVINPYNKQTSISRNGLSALFKMRLTHWNDGTQVVVFVLPDDHPLHKQFSKKILNVFPHQLRRIWNNAVFSGSGQEPITLNSPEEMKEMVANTPGAIGYLSIDEIDKQVNVLHIQ